MPVVFHDHSRIVQRVNGRRIVRGTEQGTFPLCFRAVLMDDPAILSDAGSGKVWDMRSVAVITGASKGIGAATARLFAAEGYDICISYLSDEAAATATVEDCIAHGARAIAATMGSPNEYVHYAASKGAVETLSIGAGKELAPEGIRVNAIRVGTTNTGIHQRSGNPDRPGKVAALTPMGRIAEVDDIAQAALWLASARSAFVTGTVLTVAGGLAP